MSQQQKTQIWKTFISTRLGRKIVSPGSKRKTALQLLLENLKVEDREVAGRHGGIPIRRYTPDSGMPGKIVWVHGGAFSGGGLDQLESHAAAAALAQQTGFEVITVDYRRVPQWNPMRDPRLPLSPGIRFPGPLEDVIDVFETVTAEHDKVMLGGASAGACLAAAATVKLRDEERQQPLGLVLAYGTFHAALPPLPPALRRRVQGVHGIVQFRPQTVHRMNLNYAGSEEAMEDPHAFPGGHDLTGLPRTFLIDADRDTLRASSQIFAAELLEAGVNVTSQIIPDSTHGFLDRPQAPFFALGIEAVNTWIKGKPDSFPPSSGPPLPGGGISEGPSLR